MILRCLAGEVVVVDQRKCRLDVCVDVGIEFLERSAHILCLYALLRLQGIGQAEIPFGLRGVVSHAESIGEGEHTVSPAEQRFGTVAFEFVSTEGVDGLQGFVGRGHGLIAFVPHAARVVIVRGGDILPTIHRFLIRLGRILLAIIHHVVGTHLQHHGRHTLRISHCDEIAHLLLRIHGGAIVRKFVQEVVARGQRECKAR